MVNHVLTLILNKRKQAGEYFIDPFFSPLGVPSSIKPLEALIQRPFEGRSVEEKAYYLNAFLLSPDMRVFLTHRDGRLIDIPSNPSFFTPERRSVVEPVVEWAAGSPTLFDVFTGQDSRLSGLRSAFDVSFDPAVQMAAVLTAYAYKLEGSTR